MKTIILLLSFLCFNFELVQSQNIITIAGNGSQGYSGNGMLANSGYVEFNNPTGLVIDKFGNIYIVDSDNNVIRKINTNGVISVFAGIYMSIYGGYNGDGGPATDAEINEPGGICTNIFGDIFIADYDNNVIRKVNTSGIISTVVGCGFRGYSGDGGPATAAELRQPEGVFVDKYGNILISDYRNFRVRKVNTSGVISTVAGIGFDGYSGDGGLATAAEISDCFSSCIDSVGNIIIVDGRINRIREVNTSGIISTVAGTGYQGYSGDGGPATAAELYYPFAICFDNSGDIIFTDGAGSASNQRIRKIDKTGIITTIAGIGQSGYSGDGGPATAAEIDGAWGIYPDSYGNIFFADVGNEVIREIVYYPTGIEGISATGGIIIYPNPTNQQLNLQFNRQLSGLATLSIMDITGREVFNYQLTVDNSQLIINVSSLATGMYFLGVKTKDTFVTQKFIKQ